MAKTILFSDIREAVGPPELHHQDKLSKSGSRDGATWLSFTAVPQTYLLTEAAMVHHADELPTEARGCTTLLDITLYDRR